MATGQMKMHVSHTAGLHLSPSSSQTRPICSVFSLFCIDTLRQSVSPAPCSVAALCAGRERVRTGVGVIARYHWCREVNPGDTSVTRGLCVCVNTLSQGVQQGGTRSTSLAAAHLFVYLVRCHHLHPCDRSVGQPGSARGQSGVN